LFLRELAETWGKHWRTFTALMVVQLTVLLFVFAWIKSGAVSGAFSDFQAIWVAGKSLLSGGQPAELYSPTHFFHLIE
jgi:hypothetical protein